jgi:hypothetical protein
MPNHYQVLGLHPKGLDVSLKDVKKAYRKLALVTHPDRGGDEAEFKAVQKAYETLNKSLEESTPASPPLYPANAFIARFNLYKGTWPLEEREFIGHFILVNGRAFSNNIAALYEIEKTSLEAKEWALDDQNDIEYFTLKTFEKPVDRLFWQIIMNDSYIRYIQNKGSYNRNTDSPQALVNAFRAQEKEGSLVIRGVKANQLSPIGHEISDEMAQLTEIERLWLFVIASVSGEECGIPGETPYRNIIYLNEFKWKLIKARLPDYISTHGVDSNLNLIGLLKFFGCADESECGVYINTVYEKFVLPLESKIIKLREHDDLVSHDKADQLQTALNAIEEQFKKTIEHHVELQRGPMGDFAKRWLMEDLHTELKSTVKAFAESENINAKRNLIKYVLKSMLGVLLATISVGFALISTNFRCAFFYTDSKRKLYEGEMAAYNVFQNSVSIGDEKLIRQVRRK